MSDLVIDFDRPGWVKWFMRQAYVIAERGSCRRKKVGAIVVRDHDHRVVAGGYNGAPRGMPNCLDAGCDVRSIDGRDSCVRTLHAESNAIDMFTPDSTQAYTLFTTVIPCRNCALRIVQAGIGSVVYHEFYRSQGTDEVEAIFLGRDPATLELTRGQTPRVRMHHLGLPLFEVKPSYREDD